MAKKKRTETKKPIESYEHKGKQRVNNPPVGLVTPDTDPDAGAKKTYAYDPHLDPQLQWAGKAEHTSFEIPTVSLHVHERIDPRTIIEAVRKRNGDRGAKQGWLFEMTQENPPLREAIEFYQHAHGWSNRLIAGDSLLVMNSLLEKEGMAGKVQMAYLDPPYGIKYGSNFQPFVNKRDVKDGKDEDLTGEPEQIRAFRDTWELGIHSYLTYLRDRLLLERELLTESGSVFVQISDENVHRVRELMDEVFGAGNFVAQVNYRSMSPLGQKGLASIYDYIVWYAKSKDNLKFRPIFIERDIKEEPEFCYLDAGNGNYRKLSSDEIFSLRPEIKLRVFKRSTLTSSGYTPSCTYTFDFENRTYKPLSGKSWRTHSEGMANLIRNNRLIVLGKNPYFRQYHADFPMLQLENSWHDTAAGFSDPKVYVVQTNVKVIERCLLMTTDPGDLVLDITCGSGTTAYVSEQWGRRWITCDTSRVALTLAKQRLMTAVFDYYELAHPQEGVGSGFTYDTVPHVTLKSIANNEPPPTETLYDKPLVDRQRRRVSGPFTVEAVPAPAVKSVEEILESQPQPADVSIARSGETLRQGEWRDELLRTGIRGKAGQYIRFARLEPLPGCRHLHADGETRPSDEGKNSVREKGTAYAPQRIVVSFGPEHAPLEQRQVAQAIEEAQTLVPKPKLIVFTAFQFDPEAAKDIDETNWPGVTLLKAQMNADLLTDDLKKKRASNESFWLIGQPDVRLERIAKGEDKGKWRVSVQGFDYYNTRTGGVESGCAGQIAVWLLDTDYDGRSLYPRQVFFPQAGEGEGWARLAKNIKAEIDEQLIEAYRGTESLPFAAGEHKRIAVKIVDDRGIESLKVLGVE
jgi:adenine-specific DNA-methyltransferase